MINNIKANPLWPDSGAKRKVLRIELYNAKHASGKQSYLMFTSDSARQIDVIQRICST